MHVLGSCEASAQYSPINFFVNLFHSKNSNLPDCFSDLIHTEYRKLHKNNGHSPFVSPSIMRSSVGQCRNIRFRQLSACHVIITSELYITTDAISMHVRNIKFINTLFKGNHSWNSNKHSKSNKKVYRVTKYISSPIVESLI